MQEVTPASLTSFAVSWLLLPGFRQHIGLQFSHACCVLLVRRSWHGPSAGVLPVWLFAHSSQRFGSVMASLLLLVQQLTNLSCSCVAAVTSCSVARAILECISYWLFDKLRFVIMQWGTASCAFLAPQLFAVATHACGDCLSSAAYSMCCSGDTSQCLLCCFRHTPQAA